MNNKLWKVTHIQYFEKTVAYRKIRIFTTKKAAHKFVYDEINKLYYKENLKENYNDTEGLKITYDIKSSNVVYNHEYTVTTYKEGELI